MLDSQTRLISGCRTSSRLARALRLDVSRSCAAWRRYAVKYGILKTLCLETGDDPERDGIEHKPDASKKTINKIEAIAKHIETNFVAGNKWAAFEAWESRGLDQDDSAKVWNLLGSKCRSTIKTMAAEAAKPETV